MKHVWKMLMAALLACMLLVPMGAGAEVKVTGCVAKQDDVPVVVTPADDADVAFTVDEGYEFEIVRYVIEDGKVAWIEVSCKNPLTGATSTGYVDWDNARLVFEEVEGDSDDDTTTGGDDEEDSGIQDSTDSTLNDKYTVTEVDFEATASLNVGLYKEPDTDSNLLATIPEDAQVDVTGLTYVSPSTWYRVVYNGKVGFVPATMLERVTDSGADEEEEETYTVVGYGVTQNTNGVNLRQEPSTTSTSLDKLVSGIEVELLSIPEKIDTNHWFMVRYNKQVGFIQSPYIKVLGDDTATDVPSDEEDEDDVNLVGIIVNTNGVNFREKADKNSTSMGLLKADTVVLVLQVPEKFDSNHWYKVRYDGKVGYIQAPYVRVPSLEGEDEEPEDEETAAPEYDVLFQGVVVNTNGLNFRKGPGTNYESMKQLPSGTKLGILEVPNTFTKSDWFKVLYNGEVGYVQAPYVKVEGLTDKPTEAPTVDPEDETIIGIGLIQNTNGVNFREEADTSATSMGLLKAGTLVDVISAPNVNDAKHWFKVRYDGKVGYIQAPYVYLPGWVFSGEEDEPTPTPETDVRYNGVIQNTNGVNFRKGPGTGYDSMALLKAGVKVEVLDPLPEAYTSSYWFKVRYNNQVGYVQAPYVYIAGVTPEEDDEPTPTPAWDDDVVGTGMITGTNGVNLREGPSVHYDSLMKLTTGTSVQLLKIPAGTDGDSWFKIRVNGKDGYVQAPYVVVLEGDIPGSEGTTGAIGVGVVTSSNGVNFRTGPSKEYGTMGKIPLDTAVDLLSIPSAIGEDYWYKVAYNGKTGYVQSPYIRVVSIDADALPDVSLFGYAKLLEDSANLRDSAAGNTVVTWKAKGSLLRIAGDSVTNGYYEWIPVFYPADSAIYYVRADMVQIVTVENGQIVTPTPAPASRYGYVITTGQNVNLRIQPDEESFAKIPKGTVLVCVADPLDPLNSKYTWYEVIYNGMTGFVRGDYVVVCDRNGTPVEDEDDTTTPDEDEAYVVYGYIKVTPLVAGNRVNLRDKQAGERIGLLDGGLILPVIEPKTAANIYGQYSWYKVRTADGLVGYVRGDCAKECDEKGNLIVTPEEPDEDEETISGYVLVTGNNVYVRQQPFGVALTQVANGTVQSIIGASKTSNEITWYYISANGQKGYIHGDYVRKLTAAEEVAYEQFGTIPEQDAPVDTTGNYVITVNTNGLNLRASYSQDSNSLYKVKSGVVMEYIGVKQVGTVTWYNVIYENIELWAHGGYLQVMTEAEYKAYLAENPDFLPDVSDNLGYVKTLQSSVPVRNAANGSQKIATVAAEGTILRYYTEQILAGGDYWYRVYVAEEGKFGYVLADLVQKCDASGEVIVPEYNSANKSQQESSYSTLKYGSSGDAVANLVQELINQGFYTGKVTSSYTTAVKAAVMAFQEAHGLDADGIADSSTQHALYGTVPIGAGDTSNLNFTIYKVEKIDWFDGGIQQLIPKGSNFKIYDVKTGIVWWAHRWSGAYHADIETLTKADSRSLCQIYGVDDLQEIVDENMWQRRPCLVTIGTRTFACSLDGMQHNPDGDTIGNNGMDGQICLHFTNSLGHSSGEVSESHSEAIEYAYTYNYSGRDEYVGD